MALSPRESTTTLEHANTFLFCHRNAQDAQYPWDIFRLHIAILFLIEAIEDFPIFFDKLRAYLGFQFNWCLLFDLWRGALHIYNCLTNYKSSKGLNILESNEIFLLGGKIHIIRWMDNYRILIILLWLLLKIILFQSCQSKIFLFSLFIKLIRLIFEKTDGGGLLQP